LGGRHAKLSLRKPEHKSAAEIKGFTPENAAPFFDIFYKEMEKMFRPDHLFSVPQSKGSEGQFVYTDGYSIDRSKWLPENRSLSVQQEYFQ
jgi:hypothetical protein